MFEQLLAFMMHFTRYTTGFRRFGKTITFLFLNINPCYFLLSTESNFSRLVGCGKEGGGEGVGGIDRMCIVLVWKTSNNDVFCASRVWLK